MTPQEKIQQVTTLAVKESQKNEYYQLGKEGRHGQIVFNRENFLNMSVAELAPIFQDLIFEEIVDFDEKNEVRVYVLCEQFFADYDHIPEYTYKIDHNRKGRNGYPYAAFQMK